MKQVCSTLLMTIIFGQAFTQSIFNNPITGTNPNSSNPYTTGQTVSAGITVSGIGRGSGITGSNTNNRYNATGWNSAALDANDYYEFIITPNAGSGINFIGLQITLQHSSTGPANYVLRCGTDAFTSNIGTLVSNTTTGAINTISLTAPAYQHITSAITFRVYAWGASSAAGSFSVNDFDFTGAAAVLPVTLSYFTGVAQNTFHVLSWKTETVVEPGAVFNVERSANGQQFISVYRIAATAQRCQYPFEYIDDAPLPGANYYRLQTTESNGSMSYGHVILLKQPVTRFEITCILPSVVSATATVYISSTQKTGLTITVSDLSGRLVLQQYCYIAMGNQPVAINVSGLAAGIYQLSGYTADGQYATRRFIKQ